MNKKYELIPSDIEGLFRVKALRSFSIIEKGAIGGYVEGEHNLSHEGDCWVYENAKIYGDAKIYGQAEVYGNAKVSGNTLVYDNARVFGIAAVFRNARVFGRAAVFGMDIVTKPVIHMILPKQNITVTDNQVNIGCEQHTIEYWLKNYRKIGKDNKYKECEIELYRYILNGIYIYQKGIKDEQ